MSEVIGNDNAEKIQILPATIARTDRNCPEYHDNYEDENTFYAGMAIWVEYLGCRFPLRPNKDLKHHAMSCHFLCHVVDGARR